MSKTLLLLAQIRRTHRLTVSAYRRYAQGPETDTGHRAYARFEAYETTFAQDCAALYQLLSQATGTLNEEEASFVVGAADSALSNLRTHLQRPAGSGAPTESQTVEVRQRMLIWRSIKDKLWALARRELTVNTTGKQS
jgi:hypothetical protein